MNDFEAITIHDVEFLSIKKSNLDDDFESLKMAFLDLLNQVRNSMRMLIVRRKLTSCNMHMCRYFSGQYPSYRNFSSRYYLIKKKYGEQKDAE